MKRHARALMVIAAMLICAPCGAQSEKDSTLLGLAGDNLDLYAVLDLFQRSKTIEEFEKQLNLEKTGINNLDLDLDGKADFIKVVTRQDKDNFTFVMQVHVNKDETQDVAVIIVSRDKKNKVTMQIVGDKILYGENYIVELKETTTPAVTPNPGYKGPDTVKIVQTQAKTTTVVVESAPVVQYIYSPAYMPYYPPYYYGYYPPYFMAFSVVAVGMYWGHHAHYHHHGHYHGNTAVVHNHNTYNNYNRNRNTSGTVDRNRERGDYNRGDGAANRPSQQPSGGRGDRPSGGNANRPSQQPAGGRGEGGFGGNGGQASQQPAGGRGEGGFGGNGNQASQQPAGGRGDRGSSGASASQQPANERGGRGESASQRPSASDRQSGASRQGSSRYSGGNNFGSGGGGGFGGGGGGFRGGGGGRRR